MLTAEEFDSLEVGDHIETEPMFPALTAEKVTLQTVQKSVDGLKAEFVVTYVGITLGRWIAEKKHGGVSWLMG